MNDTNLKNKKLKVIFWLGIKTGRSTYWGLRYRNDTTERKRKVRTLRGWVARRSMLKIWLKLPMNRRQHTVIIVKKILLVEHSYHMISCLYGCDVRTHTKTERREVVFSASTTRQFVCLCLFTSTRVHWVFMVCCTKVSRTQAKQLICYVLFGLPYPLICLNDDCSICEWY